MESENCQSFMDFINNIFMRCISSDEIQNEFWKIFFESDLKKINLDKYNKIKNDLFKLISNLLLSKNKTEFFVNCNNIISSNLFPLSSNNRKNILLWTNFGLENINSNGQIIFKSLLNENEYENYMSDTESPVFQFIWVLTEKLLFLIKNKKDMNFLGIKNVSDDCKFFLELFQEQKNIEVKNLESSFQLIFSETCNNSFIREMDYYKIFDNIEQLSLKFSEISLLKEVEKFFIKDSQELNNIIKITGEAELITNSDPNSQELINIDYVGEKYRSLITQFLIICETIVSSYSHIPYDKLLSELWITSNSQNLPDNIRIEFGQHTNNFGDRTENYNPYSIPHIKLNNVMASIELPLLLANIAKNNLEKKKKLDNLSSKLLTLKGSVSKRDEDDYLVFYIQSKKSFNDICKIKPENLVDEFTKETDRLQKTESNKTMNLDESSSFLKLLLNREMEKQENCNIR